MKQGQRVKYCDFLKGLSIILVILIHIFSTYRGIYFEENKVYYFILSLGDSFTRIAVPIFFMITGIFMLSKKHNESYKQYFFKRMPKLIISFLVFSIVYYIYETRKSSDNYSLLYFLQTLTTYGGFKYHLWFMYEIIRIYLLIPFISILAKNITKKKLANLIILIYILGNVAVFSQMFSYKYEYNLLSGLPLSSLAICINYLLLGYYLYNNNISKKNRKRIYILGIISIILMPIFDMIYIGDTRIGEDFVYTVSSVFPIFPAMATFVFFKYNYEKLHIAKRIEKIMSKIANNSLYIYLVHVIIVEYITQFIMKHFEVHSFPIAIIAIIVTLILATVISYIASVIINYIYNLIAKILKRLFDSIIRAIDKKGNKEKYEVEN